ncbi:lysylphosphatidylglycerol synthase transmembrane domain-containing protein [Thermodesulfobacteriota bacterium]
MKEKESETFTWLSLAKKLSRGPLGIAIGLGILVVCLFRIGFRDIVTSFSGLEPGYLLAVAGAVLCWILIGALNIKVMLSPLARPPFLQVFRLYTRAAMVSLVVPGQVGDAVLVSFFRRFSIPISQGATIFGIDKLITLLWYFLFGLYGCFLLDLFSGKGPVSRSAISPVTVAILLLLTVIGLILFFVLLNSRIGQRIQNWVRLSFEYIAMARKAIILDLCITGFRTLTLGCAYWFIIQAYGPAPSFIQTLCLAILGGLVAYIPLSFNGLGTVEAALIYLFGRVGIESSQILAAALSLRVITIVIISSAAFVSSLMYREDDPEESLNH